MSLVKKEGSRVSGCSYQSSRKSIKFWGSVDERPIIAQIKEIHDISLAIGIVDHTVQANFPICSGLR